MKTKMREDHSKKRQYLFNILYATGAFLLIVIAFETYFSFQRLMERDYWVTHTNQVLYTAEKELSLLKDAQLGTRGYVITTDSSYLAPYFNSKDSILYYFHQLKKLTQDNPSQQSRLDLLEKEIAYRLTLFEEIIRLKNNNREELNLYYTLQKGKASMDTIRKGMQSFSDEEKRLLSLRNNQFNQSIQRTRLATYLIIGASLGIDLLLLMALRRKFALRAAYEGKLQEKNETLSTTNEELVTSNEELRKTQLKLVEANTQLEDRVKQRTSQLEEAKEQASQKAEQFRMLLETLPVMTWTADAGGNRHFFNKQSYAYTQASYEQLKGWGWLAYLHPEDVETTKKAWRNALQKGASFELVNRWKRGADHSYRWHLTRVEPLRDEKGKVNLWIGTSIDIDEERMREKALEETNKQLEAQNRIGKTLSAQLELSKLVQEVTDVTTEISGAEFGAFFYNTINDKGDHMTLYTLSGAPMEAFAHYPLPRFTAIFSPTFHGEGIIRSDDITKDARYGKNPPYQGMPHGHLPVKSYLAVPVISRSGKILGGLFFGHSKAGVFSESTEQLVNAIATQASIAIDNAFLFEASLADKKELSLINLELERTNKMLLQTNTDLDNFVYTASHDLKAPIANMEGLTTQLKNKLSKSIGEKENRLLDLLTLSVSKLKKVISDLTEITKVQKDLQEIPERVSIEAILEEIRADIAPLVEDSQVIIRTNLAITHIRYSRKNLRSILYNLLSNAIKYRSSSREASVEVITKEVGSYDLLTVKDNGLGIAPDQIHKLFTMFKRLHTHVEGTGIGLYIVKRIIENRGGYIEVESQLGEGTTFHVYFAKENE